MIKTLDSRLISRAQWFCDKFHDLTGLTKFTLQRWALILSWMFFCVSSVIMIIGSGIAWVVYVLLPLPSLCAIRVFFLSRNIKREEIEFLRSGKLEYNIFHSTPTRLILVLTNGIMAVVNLVSLNFLQELAFLGTVFLIAWFYFSICIPRPPGKNKVREWYENGLWWLDSKLQEAPIAAPG